jgi:hypothetical protein
MKKIQAFLFIFLTCLSNIAAASLPDIACEQVEAWAEQYDPAANISMTPKIEISALLSDELFQPLYGKTALAMDSKELSAVGGQIQKCRKLAAKRKDKAALNQLSQAMKAVKKASSNLRTINRFNKSTSRIIDNILQSKSFPGLAKVIDLARQALQGEDIIAQLNADKSLGRLGSSVGTIQNNYGWLTKEQCEAFIKQLSEREVSAIAEANAHQESLLAFKKNLANVSEDQAGINQLLKLSKDPILEKIDRKEAYALQQQINSKRYAIQNKLKHQQARKAAAEAARPMEITRVLEQLIIGNELSELSLKGLRPGISEADTKRQLQSGWRGYRQGNSIDYLSSYALNKKNMSALIKKEKRNGGAVNFTVLTNKAVGKVSYEEVYKASLPANSVQDWVTQKLGKPETANNTAYGRVMIWKEKDLRFQVKTGGVDVLERGAGYRSKLNLSIWNEDYEEYLAEKHKRCSRIKKQPRNELSTEDSAWFLQNCSLL